MAGTAVTVGLRAGAAVQRRREMREAARDWAALGHDRQPFDTDRARSVVAVLIGIGPAVAVAALGAVAEREQGVGRWWMVAVVSCAVVGVFLILAGVYGRPLRQRRPAGRPRPPRNA
ncbi:hypothetical protein [Streptomyces sp. NPDC020298]|uniref:hypothetical protein n=1 Tax=unclassified Streptomyces TaxID=2593676 RepID=UPI0033F628EF